jgi:hypothetical protein
MRRLYFIPLLLPILTIAQARASTILYSNITTDAGFTDSFSQNSLVEAGDQVHLISSGVAYTVNTELFNSASVSGTALTVTLRLYSVDVDNNLGSEIASSTLDNVSFAAGSIVPLAFTDLDAPIPQDLVWTLSFATSDAITLELPNFDPPTIGSSDNTTVWWDTGSGLELTTPGFDTENYYFELDGATPEPGSAFLTLAGLCLAAGLWRQRRMRASSGSV